MKVLLLILSLLAIGLALPQGYHQHLDLIRKARKTLTWGTLGQVVTSQATSGDVYDECVGNLSFALNHFMQSPELTAFVLYSGKQIYDPGDYVGCKNTPGSYFLETSIHIKSAYEITIRIFLCLPRVCSVDYFNEIKPIVTNAISGFLDIPLQDDDITFSDIAAINKKLNEIGIGFVCTLLFLFLMAGACVVATVMDYYGKLKGNTKGSQIFLSFSLRKNMRSLFNNENRVDPKLNLFNGVRVLSIGWVVLNHSWIAIPYEEIVNLEDTVEEVPLEIVMSFVKAAPLAVDIFFVLSGFLCALGLCSAFKNPKNRTFGGAIMAIVNRFLRFFPMHLVALLWTTFIVPTTADSPGNHMCNQHIMEPCRKQWFYTLSHVNNFLRSFSSMCMSWTWYLHVDMQFFICTIPLIFLYLKSKKWCFSTMGILSGISFGYQAYICAKYHLHKSYIKPLDADMLTLFFMQPLCRYNTYFVGMFLYFAYEDSKKEEGKGEYLPFKTLQHWIGDKSVIRYINYAIGFFFMTFVVFSSYLVDRYADSYTDFLGALDVMFSRPVFTIGFAMMMYPILIGKGKLMLSILAFPMFGPMAKITFGVYILHLQFLFYLRQHTLHYVFYTDSYYFTRMLAIFLGGYVISFFISLTVEVPCMQIQKLLLGPPQRRPALPTTDKKGDDEKKLTEGSPDGESSKLKA